jgi:hypothetical protein
MESREVIGNKPRRMAIWAIGGLAIGLLAGWMITLIWPGEYTSTARVRVVPSQIPEYFVPIAVPLTAGSLTARVNAEVGSRNSVANFISTYDLYPEERTRLPLEDVIEMTTEQIRVETKGDAIEVAFTYRDATAAMKVTRDLMTKLIDETIRQRSSNSKMTTEFLKEQREDAARDWRDLVDLSRTSSANDARMQLDRELARQRYEKLSLQVNESQMMTDVETRKQGPTLEVLDLPVTPEHPNPVMGLPNEGIIAIAGLVGFAAAMAKAGSREKPTEA